MTIRKLTIILFFLFALASCNEQIPPVKKETKFTIVDIHITENGVKNIKNCANWYIDFSRIKRTVVYKDKIICVGFNGGFACLNSLNLNQDTILENKLNTDFFTNATVYQDTLIAEKFDKLFYWNSDKWVEYLHPLPIKYFDLLLEDKSYAFYSSCMGEFGSILFAYNKTTGRTRAEFTTCPNSVVKTTLGYYVGTHLYHMMGWSDSYIIKDVEKLKIVPDSLRNSEGFDIDTRFTFLRDTSLEARNNYLPFKFSIAKEMMDTSSNHFQPDIMVIASFNNNGKMYHIIDSRDFNKRAQKYIGTVINDTLEIIDTLNDCTAATAFQFGNTTIINEEFYGNGFSMVRNDTIFKVTFTTLHPNYHGPKLEDYNLSTDQSKRLTANVQYTFNLNEKNDWTAKPGQPEREIEFKFRDKFKIVGNYGNGEDGSYIYINNEKMKIKFHDQWNFMETIFVYDDRLFVFFKNLGNIGFKYGLIEITDVENFAKIYTE
jgi:hypothetical protein